MLFPNTSLNCRGRLLDLSKPVIMGILNVTPDSFFDGGRYSTVTHALSQAERMLEEGASIIDVGGMSTRPNAEMIDPAIEQQRVLPVIEAILKLFPDTIISIDTIYAQTARAAAAAGVSIINDVSAGRLDTDMYETVAELGLPYVLMHSKGTPQTMTKLTEYTDVVAEVLDFFIQETGKLKALGVKDIVIDPGLGFAKKIEHSYTLLKSLEVFKILDYPIMAGVSRKSMIYRLLNTDAANALNGATALHMVALQNGARLLRVHDVLPAMEVIKLWETLYVD
jgi:dihydropteroate synthase